jgi:hypothetical protein
MTTAAPLGPRLKGQEISVRILQGNPPEPIASLDSISTFNQETTLKLLEDGFLGEVTNRFDEILDGYGGDFEMHVTNSGWISWEQAVITKATRTDPTITFNVVRVDLFADGSSLIYVYTDVHWAAIPQKVGGRGEYLKVSSSFKCSTRPVLQDQI